MPSNDTYYYNPHCVSGYCSVMSGHTVELGASSNAGISNVARVWRKVFLPCEGISAFTVSIMGAR